MGTLRITPTVESRIFQCPKCKETINTSVTQCPYCSVAIDPRAAEVAAEAMSKLNQACSDASYLRIMAGTMVAFFFLSFLPLVGFVATLGHWFLLLAVPTMTIRWWVKFGSLTSEETDWHRAKRTVLISAAIWAAFLVLLLVMRFVSRTFDPGNLP
jgi:hypothetical protein